MTSSFKYFNHNSMKDEEVRLNDEQFVTLKELYVERLVDNMSTKDLVQYVTDDMSDYVNKLTFTEVLEECNNYWDDGLTEIIEEVKEIDPNV